REPDVARRRTDENLLRAGRDRPTVTGRIPIGQRARVEREAHAGHFSRLEAHLLDTFELPRRLRRRIGRRQADVELYHLRARPAAAAYGARPSTRVAIGDEHHLYAER